MTKIILFDVDGTLANISHRRSSLDGSKPDWKLFNSLMGEDKPNGPIVELYKTLWETQHYQLILVSGRSENQRSVTEQWLVWNEIPFDQLLMRSEGDFRPDVEIKREFLEEIRQSKNEILLAVDDRQSVVAMWRENGITCLQCDVGDF